MCVWRGGLKQPKLKFKKMLCVEMGQESTSTEAFVEEIFAKQYWCFLIVDFQCIVFHISPIMHLQSLQIWIITE